MTKTIFITGASSGLGQATAQLFAERGWTVFAGVRAGSENASQLSNLNGVKLVSLDVTQPEQIARAADEAFMYGPVDLVFANAGYALGGPLEFASDDQIVRQIETNLLGPIRTVKAFLPHFREHGHGGFLVTASTAGYVGMPLISSYAATKFGLVGWAESLAYELPEELFIKLIVPGSMKTNFLHAADRSSHPTYADLTAKTDAFYATASDRAEDGRPDIVAEEIWKAATDGKRQVAYFVTEEARQTSAARETLGAEGFRAQIRQMLGI